MDNPLGRRNILMLIILGMGLTLVARLFYMQVIDDQWDVRAASLSQKRLSVKPPRGNIYDRNGQPLVQNESEFRLFVLGKDVPEQVDTALLCEILSITSEECSTALARIREPEWRSQFTEFIPKKRVRMEHFLKYSTQMYRIPGFQEQLDFRRSFPMEVGAGVLGYMAEVDGKAISKDHYYVPGDYIGKRGLEESYESRLRGVKGARYTIKDKSANIIGSLEEGDYDTLAIPGKNLTLFLDRDLQVYGEKLMQGKIGAIVAIEPKTGGILTMVNSPTYKPSDMPARYGELVHDELKPLFNRALQSVYPPGSTFKLAQALTALDLGLIDMNTGFACNKSLVGCHNHPHPSDPQKAIQFSCNPYFYYVTQRIIQGKRPKNIFKESAKGIEVWKKYMESFGFGLKPTTDMYGSGRGFLPDKGFYDRYHGEGRWAYSTIYSISIGQGEVLATPLQMANFAAILANRGYYYEPHFVQTVEGGEIDDEYIKRNYTLVDTSYFEAFAEAMRMVVEEPGGTARRARIDSITVCGKTGTAQNPHGEDHSIFIAFAPKDDPKIAIAVYVENAGFGGTWAAPIASLMIEQYLSDSISNTRKEERILNQNFITTEDGD